MDILIGLLVLVIGGVMRAWRGSQYTFGNFITAFICSAVVVLSFNYFILANSLSIYNVMGAICTLAWVEMVLGYGAMAYFLNMKPTIEMYIKLQKEVWEFLGLVSMVYCLLPALFLLPNKPPIVYLIIAVVGFGVFPLAKYVSMLLDKKNVSFDTWKVAEFIIGVGIILSWIIGKLMF